jgi:hypothetical protein
VLTGFHCTHVIADATNLRVEVEDVPIKMKSVGFPGDMCNLTAQMKEPIPPIPPIPPEGASTNHKKMTNISTLNFIKGYHYSKNAKEYCSTDHFPPNTNKTNVYKQ